MKLQFSLPLAALVPLLSFSFAWSPVSMAQTSPKPLKQGFQNRFLIGATLGGEVLQGRDARRETLARTHFSAFTAGNSMKPDVLQPRRGVFNFVEADYLVDLAERSGATPIGHTLLWHQQTPKWFTQDEAGKPLPHAIALRNLREHIATVVGRYRGRVKQWDVVNEAISDSDGEYLRPTPWLAAIGPDYIAEAFRAAHRADPDAILILNDYNTESGAKRDRNLRLLRQLLAQGVPVHAVGLQCHWRLGNVPTQQTEKSIGMYAALGLKVMVTEMDIGVLPTDYNGADITRQEAANAASNQYTQGLPPEVAEKLAAAYRDAFAMFLRHQKQIGRVTLWGIDDGDSWLNDFPTRGRTDYPLLFDRAGQPKAAFFAVQKAAAATPQK